jgi:hypothetical protein
MGTLAVMKINEERLPARICRTCISMYLNAFLFPSWIKALRKGGVNIELHLLYHFGKGKPSWKTRIFYFISTDFFGRLNGLTTLKIDGSPR